LGENVFNIKVGRPPSPKLSTAPEDAVKALMPVAHSLETLVHIDPMFRTYADATRPPVRNLTGEGLRNFFSLTSIDCDPCSFLHQGIIASRTLAPPNLEKLRIRYHDRHYQRDHSLFDELPDSNSYAQLYSLKTLEFVQPAITPRPLGAGPMADYICEESRLRERHAYAYKFWKRGVQMKVCAEMHRKFTLIPPYLHTEPRPELLLLYDADTVGFYRDPTQPLIGFDNELDDAIFDEKIFLYPNAPPLPESAVEASSSNGAPVELQETDQLGDMHILQLRNETHRTIRQYIADVGIRDRGDQISDDFDSDEDSDDDTLTTDSSEMDSDYDMDDLIEMEDVDEIDDDEELDLDLAEEGMDIDAGFLDYLLGEADGELSDVYEDADEFLASEMTIGELLDTLGTLGAGHHHEADVGEGAEVDADADADAEDYIDHEAELFEEAMSDLD
jgi:hypothetical protein